MYLIDNGIGYSEVATTYKAKICLKKNSLSLFPEKYMPPRRSSKKAIEAKLSGILGISVGLFPLILCVLYATENPDHEAASVCS